MSTVRKKYFKRLKEVFPEVEIKYTYGSFTKAKRSELELEKDHSIDAYCIALEEKEDIVRFNTFEVKQLRRNNRCLEMFYDAKYIDLRNGKKVSGKDLHLKRTGRSMEGVENLRVYRGHKAKKGQRRIRKQRYKYQQ